REKIMSRDPRLFHYLCMETKSSWQNVYGFVPDSARNLDAMFDDRRHFVDSVLGTTGAVPSK
ncbi:MAG: hypothetical protein KDK25_09185, partial [Leptospiraceae bacterium]|nr:hypothetical protein [Leptospiraceae bacterium]